jgi:hypothetical protein
MDKIKTEGENNENPGKVEYVHVITGVFKKERQD